MIEIQNAQVARAQRDLKDQLKNLIEEWISIKGYDSSIVITAFAEATAEEGLMYLGLNQTLDLIAAMTKAIDLAATQHGFRDMEKVKAIPA